MQATWRLICHPTPGDGAWNMAVDEAILEAAGCGAVLPTLRLYAWEPACLSLGFAQSSGEVDRARLQARGWGLVRRLTGGRAVLHVDELTYSVSGPLEEHHLAGGVLESYHTLSGALVQALRSLGVSVQVSGQGKPARGTPNPVCFEVPSTYEITAEGRKLIGSAQARRKEGVLQHGSLPLHGDLRRILQVIHFPDETARQAAGDLLLARAVTLEGVLGRHVTWEQAAEAFCAAFQDVLGIILRAESLSPRELARAEQLLADKYTRREWTEKKG